MPQDKERIARNPAPPIYDTVEAARQAKAETDARLAEDREPS